MEGWAVCYFFTQRLKVTGAFHVMVAVRLSWSATKVTTVMLISCETMSVHIACMMVSLIAVTIIEFR